MTQVFHQIRSRSRALAQGLLLVLLATWLAGVCPHCLAVAADAPEASMHCHGDAPPAKPYSAGHDCCPQAPACSGGNCVQLTAIEPGEPLSALLPESSSPVFVSTDFLSITHPSTPPPTAPDAHTAVFDPCPLYLRHCTFLN